MAEATNPQGTYRRNHGRGHSYYIDGVKVDGVTTVLSKGMPKTGLYNWAGRESAREAVDNWAELSGLPVMERFERIAGAANATRDTAAVRGTRVHGYAERVVHGEQVNVPDAIYGHVQACASFLDAWDVQPLLTEVPVFSRAHRYAGSPDLFAFVAARDLPVLIDWKTNRKGPYGDQAFQLAAYRYADFYLEPVLAPTAPDGQAPIEAWRELPVPEVCECWTVWLRDDGWDAYPMECGPKTFKQFLYIQQTAWAVEDSRDYKGDALEVPAQGTRTAKRPA